jgi:hypothetical protein
VASWVILEPPADAAKTHPVFVRDDFRWLGLIAPPLWLAWHRLWLEALIALAALILINAAATSGSVSPMISWLSPLVGLFVGLEGPAMRIARLRRRGYREASALAAADIEEAELRYAESEETDDYGMAEVAPLMPPTEASPSMPARNHAPALGLFSYPSKS